jgi:integrase/recombinase XerD
VARGEVHQIWGDSPRGDGAAGQWQNYRVAVIVYLMSEIELSGTVLPALPGGDGDALRDATIGWLFHHRTSRHTQIAYQRGLLGLGTRGTPVPMKAPAWLPWCEQRGLDPLKVTLTHVDIYGEVLAAAGIADRSQAARLATVSSWYGWLIHARLIDRNPAAGATRPNIDADEFTTTSLSEDELNLLLDQAETDGPRSAALIAVLYFGALRVGSALSADIGDLGWEQGERTLRLRVKGGKERRIALEDEARLALDAYLATRPGALPSDPLFATSTGGRLDAAYVWRLIRRLARQAGIKSWEEFCPHGLRATHITHAFDEGVDLGVIQGTAGHVSSRTTKAYDVKRRKRLYRSGTKLSERRAKRNAEVRETA